MAAPNINAYKNILPFGRGRCMVNLIVDGVRQGLRPLGDCPDFSITVEGTRVIKTSSEGGLGEEILNQVIRISRAFTLKCLNVNDENILLSIAGIIRTITQAATPVTDEVIGPVTANYSYKLGQTVSNPVGVRGVGSVVVRIKEGDDAASRANTTAYAVGDAYVPATPNAHWYVCTVPGISAASPPTFTLDGTTFTDGAATFKDMGLIIVSSATNVNYRVDATRALLSITPTGTIATANTAYGAIVSGGLLSLNVDYTPTANTRTQVQSSSDASLTCEFYFFADNIGEGVENRDVYIPLVTLSPSGALPFITGDDTPELNFDGGITKRDSDTAAIYIDGEPHTP